MVSQEHKTMSEKVGQVADQAGEKMGQAVDKAKQQTTSRLEDGREQVAESLYTTAHALRQTGQQLREQDQGTIATLADRTAQQAERGSGYLRGRDVPGLLNDTEQLGRAPGPLHRRRAHAGAARRPVPQEFAPPATAGDAAAATTAGVRAARAAPGPKHPFSGRRRGGYGRRAAPTYSTAAADAADTADTADTPARPSWTGPRSCVRRRAHLSRAGG